MRTLTPAGEGKDRKFSLTRKGRREIVVGMAAVALLASNLFSNVPAVMLLLPVVHGTEHAVILALVSTFAGNLLLVGSVANIIVASVAQDSGITIGWKEHAKIGVPLTLVLIALALSWVHLLGGS